MIITSLWFCSCTSLPQSNLAPASKSHLTLASVPSSATILVWSSTSFSFWSTTNLTLWSSPASVLALAPVLLDPQICSYVYSLIYYKPHFLFSTYWSIFRFRPYSSTTLRVWCSLSLSSWTSTSPNYWSSTSLSPWSLSLRLTIRSSTTLRVI